MTVRRSVLWATTWAELRAHRARSSALVLTTMLGALLLAAALVLGASMQRAVTQGMDVEFENADLVIQADLDRVDGQVVTDKAGAGLAAGDVDRLAAVKGVGAVGTHVRTEAVGQVQGITRGMLVESLSDKSAFRWQRWHSGRPPASPTEVALSSRALDELRIDVGDQVALGRAGVGRANFTVVTTGSSCCAPNSTTDPPRSKKSQA